jgi:phosphomannomutase
MIDKIFKAYDVRATYPDPLNEDAAWRVGYGTGEFLKSQNGGNVGNVAVSRDMRPHSQSLQTALMNGIRAAGMNVIDLGRVDTSFQYFAINHLDAVGGVQTTASHNPINYNGFKISGKQARPIGATTGLKDIQAIAEKVADTTRPATGGYETRDLWDAYRKHVLKFLTPLKKKTRVFIDASNAMAGEMVPKVFGGIENLEIIPLNFEITGTFAHEPNPLVPENMVPTQKGVMEHGADLGACFDGDADRCMLTDEKGQIIGCDHLTALLARHFVALSRTNPAVHHEPKIVYDLRSSKVVEETIRSLGAIPLRSRVGHVFMKKVLREQDAVFGGELSGHFYFRENFYADSGAITLAVMLTVMNSIGKPVSEMVAPYRKYPQSGEINFRVADKDEVIALLRQSFGTDGAKVDDLDGVTIDAWEVKGWWFNVRPSNTEPLLRLNAEAKDPGKLKTILGELKPILGEPAAGH